MQKITLKKALIPIFVILGLIILLIMGEFLLARASDSYSLAKTTIRRSEVVANNVGSVSFVVLIGANYEMRPNSVSCAGLRFFVKGNRGSEIVAVLVRKENYQGAWDVYDLLDDRTSRDEKPCLATSGRPN
ncbi:hypothetical protein [Massilia horti]|uniref:Uncharacterized protein n=1 Tax=Massilia horti TaxID=2562153 RepID=A0A4Y9T228_9BURK|nr:hypothetical protein [Massilia horti]TFW33097.1 hypothetical protein E4O92_07480 [Massilia horti]